ncbi:MULTISPECIES: phosphoribosyl-ATP diphosphatase [Halorussus]|uniref:phosphoribosyl-ATP diphosphatase n=1 Tax=Halorussus TaxID=1070314 RepID=UPI000E2114E7|nr:MULTISPECIES: phosphoribosyl-ATP diphosphatase [Halorussus]NHN57563.1 phosphoribosyl-ATP diphosphatase [Halorussus sp. JP-T4]
MTGRSTDSEETRADADEATAAAPTDAVLDELFAVVEDRKETLPDESYTASLFTHEKGENAVLEKLGEETTELVLAAKDDDREEIAHESADIVYHLLVLLSMKDMDVADLRAELRERR